MTIALLFDKESLSCKTNKINSQDHEKDIVDLINPI